MKNNKKNIKKIILILTLVIILPISLVSCLNFEAKVDGEQDKDNKGNDNTNISDKIIKDDSDDNEKACDNDNDPDMKDKDNEDNKDGEIKVVESYLDENNFITNQDSIEVVVNKQRNLKEDYVPDDLVKITDVPTCLASPEVNQLRKVAAEALTKLVEAAKEEINIQLYARSGYRSYSTQRALYDGYVKNHGQEEADTFSAKPGQSEHQTGLAMDITSDSVNLALSEEFGDTVEGKWVSENAHRFGFIVRYQKGKEDITGYMYEPWHIRYLGVDLATKVYESGKTLEQYFFEKDE